MLSLLVLKTHQVAELCAFYSSLGIEFAEEQHGNGPVHFAGHVGDMVFEIYPLPDEDAEADTTTRLGFVVEDLDGVVQSLDSLGIAIVSKPKQTQWGYRAVVRDPDGRSVELYQR